MEQPNFNTSSIRDERHCGRRRAQNKGRNFCSSCNLAWYEKMSELIQWKAVAVCQFFSRLFGRWRKPSDKRFGEPLNAPIILLEHWLNIIRFLHETSPGTKIGKKPLRKRERKKQSWGHGETQNSTSLEG